MASRSGDWIVAASCCEGPRLCVTFADMPREHRRQMLALVFAAALSTAYFVTLGVLMQPIPSRSLAAHVALPHGTISNAALLKASPAVLLDAPPRRATRQRTVRPLAAVQLASASEPVADGGRTTTRVAPERERRRNLLSRFFGGMLRGVQSVGAKGDLP